MSTPYTKHPHYATLWAYGDFPFYIYYVTKLCNLVSPCPYNIVSHTVTHTHTFTHTHTYAHIHLHTHAHTYTYTHTYFDVLLAYSCHASAVLIWLQETATFCRFKNMQYISAQMESSVIEFLLKSGRVKL